MLSEIVNKRMTVSFTVVVALHAFIFWLLYSSSIQIIKKGKIITNVEFLEIEKPKVPSLLAPEMTKAELKPAAAPNSILQKLFQKAIEPKLPAPAPAQALKDITEEAQKKAATRAPMMDSGKIEEAKAPLRKLSPVQLDQLKQERDQKINELMDLSKGKTEHAQKLIMQEQVLTERTKPLVRPVGGNVLEAVGVKRAATADLADIAAPAEQKKAARLGGLQDAQSAQSSQSSESPLIEKKRLLKLQLAALGSQQNALPEAAKAAPQEGISDVVGTVKEKQKAKEVVELQKIIEAQSAPASSGAGEKSLDRLASARTLPSAGGPPEIPIKKTRVLEGGDAVMEVKKTPLEISGPLKQRKLLKSSAPVYPDWARKKGIEADVMLKFYVNPQGRVTNDITVVRTSGYTELDTLSIETLKKWSFMPLKVDELQQDQWGVVTIRYVLE